MSHHPPAAFCHNCQQDLRALQPANFCPHCGQETVLHPPTLWEFVHEFITHYVALEGALWRSLRLLMLRPGQLTREYLEGRRRQYVLPLRLYLTASFVFFLLLKLFGSATPTQGPVVVTRSEAPVAVAGGASAALPASAAVPAAASRPASAASADARTTPPAIATAGATVPPEELAAQQRCIELPGSCSLFDTAMARLVVRSATGTMAQQTTWWPRLVGMAPYAVFLMLPVFAGLMKLVYWRRGLPYGEHFVFSLHLHSAWFILLMVADLLPSGPDGIAQLALPVYGVLSMRRVYGGSWPATLLRAVLLTLLYGALLVIAAASLTFWVLLH